MREFALNLAQRTGAMLLDLQRQGRARLVHTKLSHMDIVTEGDLAAERLISEAIRERFPGHAIFAEESAGEESPEAFAAAEWTWFVDPVDGTTNYAHSLPLFAVSIGLAHYGQPVLGVTHAPALNCTYWAEHGEGAWLRRGEAYERLRVSANETLERALLATGFPYDRATVADNNLAEFTVLDRHAQAVRRLGSATLEMAWVAAGILDGYWENRAHAWDWAAGAVLVREAGGRVTGFDDKPWAPGMHTVIASNGLPGIHDAIRAVTRDYGGA